MALVGVFNGVVQQCRDHLIFIATVFPHQCANADQMRMDLSSSANPYPHKPLLQLPHEEWPAGLKVKR